MGSSRAGASLDDPEDGAHAGRAAAAMPLPRSLTTSRRDMELDPLRASSEPRSSNGESWLMVLQSKREAERCSTRWAKREDAEAAATMPPGPADGNRHVCKFSDPGSARSMPSIGGPGLTCTGRMKHILTFRDDYGNMTMLMMMESVSKSRFKARALEYFRQVEQTGQPIVITDRGEPVLKLMPYREDPGEALRVLRDSVVKYEAHTKPVAEGDWEAGA